MSDSAWFLAVVAMYFVQRWCGCRAAALVILVAGVVLAVAQAQAQEPCRVHDGDTIYCGSQGIRLKAIDTPELGRGNQPHDPGALEAKAALEALIADGWSYVDTGERHRKRIIAWVYTADGRDVGAELVRAGHACWWERYGGSVYRELGERCPE
ncbi:MAG: thermonuclease family protein [Pseudomonadota bacterium]